MISDACFIYGWTPMECLQMPIVTFFNMLKLGKKTKTQETHYMLHELVGVELAGAHARGGHLDYSKALTDYYESLYKEDWVEKPVGRVFRAEDPLAGEYLLDLARQKMRVDGYH